MAEQLSHGINGVVARNRSDARDDRRRRATQGIADHVNVGSLERLTSALAGAALAVWGLRRRGATGYGAALLGAELVYRGASGHCHAYAAMGISTHEPAERGTPAVIDHAKSIDVRQSVVIDRPREELFAIWRDFSTLPQFMDHLERVDVITPSVSHWVTKGPAGTSVEWDAEIVDERDGEWIAWRAIEPAQVPNAGTVMFQHAPGGGTEVFVTLEAQPPAGKLGDLVARVFGASPERQVRMALERFKEMTEQHHDFGLHAAPRLMDREVPRSAESLSDRPERGRVSRSRAPSPPVHDEPHDEPRDEVIGE